MHKTIILDKYSGGISPFQFCYTHNLSMFICREACECLARKLSPTHQYVVTFSDEYLPGYRRVQIRDNGKAKVKSHDFGLARKQQFWLRDLGLRTLDNLTGHFYVKITPFKWAFYLRILRAFGMKGAWFVWRWHHRVHKYATAGGHWLCTKQSFLTNTIPVVLKI